MIDDLMLEVLQTIEKSTDTHMPTPPNNNNPDKPNTAIPSWKTDIKP